MLHNYLLRTKKVKISHLLVHISCHISFQPHFCHHDIHQTKISNQLPIHPHSHSTTCTYPHHQPQSCYLDLHSYPIIFFSNNISTPPPKIRPSRQHHIHPSTHNQAIQTANPNHFLSNLSISKEVIHSHPTQLVQYLLSIPDKSHVQLFNPLQTQQVIQPAIQLFHVQPRNN